MVESYAALALPSWRWGTAALSFRHFGVGGIEQRDDRNVLLADDLSDEEFEAALGYGRALGDAWSVGGNVKLRHQTPGRPLGQWSRARSRRDRATGRRARRLPILGAGSDLGARAAQPVDARDPPRPRERSRSHGDAHRPGVASARHRPGRLLAKPTLAASKAAEPALHAGLEYGFHPPPRSASG